MENKIHSYLFDSPKKNNENYSNNKLYNFNNEKLGIKKKIRIKYDKKYNINKKENLMKNKNLLTENSIKSNIKNLINEKNEIIKTNYSQISSNKLKNNYKIKKLIKERPPSINFDNNLSQKGRNIKPDFDLCYSRTEIPKDKFKTKIESIKNFNKIIDFKIINDTYKNKNLLSPKTICKTPLNKNKKYKNEFISPYSDTHLKNRKNYKKNLIFLILKNILTEKNEIDNYRKNQFLNLKKQLKYGQNKIIEVFNELKAIQFHSDICLKKKNYLLRNINELNEKYGF